MRAQRREIRKGWGQGGWVGGQRRPYSLRSRHESFPLGRTGSVSCRQAPLPVQNPPQIQPLSTLAQALSVRGHHRPFQVPNVILAAIPSGCGRRNAITDQNVIEGRGRPTFGCNVAGAVSGQSLPPSPPSLSDQVRSSAGPPPTCGQTPSTASTTMMQPSQMRTAVDTSEEKSTCPGESIRLIRYSSLPRAEI